MPSQKTKESIEGQTLSKNNKKGLFAFLENFSTAEQDELNELAKTNKNFWLKLIIEVNILIKQASLGKAKDTNKKIKQLVYQLTK